MTPSGQVGHIGIIAKHRDLSGAAEKAGVKVTTITAGRFKGELNEFQPLSDPARAHIQAMANAYDTFAKAVARGRGVPESRVRGGFGEGRLVLAGPALAEGMVDRIETLEQTLGRLAGAPPRLGPRARAGAAMAALRHPAPVSLRPVFDPETERRRHRLALAARRWPDGGALDLAARKARLARAMAGLQGGDAR